MRWAGWIAPGLLLFSSAGIIAKEVEEIPLVGRPALLPFSEASARFAIGPDRDFVAPFAITTSASPTQLTSRSAITYVVTLHARGPTLRPPVRIDLRDVVAFKQLFHIEDNTDTKLERITPATWRYRYRLTPRSAEVDEIPGFPFVFYNPDLQPSEKAFQVLYSDPIAIRQAPPRTSTGPTGFDDDALTLADGPGVLARERRWSGPGPVAWATGIFAPPSLSVLCYLVWRRLYPDVARQAARRRSRAARVALARLPRAGHGDLRERAEQLTAALVGYLHERFTLGPREPTPEEVSMHLSRHGFPEELTRQASAVLAGCAAARFAPTADNTELVERARRLILDLEEASCRG